MDDVAQLKDLVRRLSSALASAHEHITEDLQPQFTRLAHGHSVQRPSEQWTDEQALTRLATWWHGVDIDELVDEARETLKPAHRFADTNFYEHAQAIERDYLSRCWSARGVDKWWDRPRDQLDGLTPAEVIATDPERVRALAEAGMSQQGT